jgi:hypothetical protein
MQAWGGFVAVAYSSWISDQREKNFFWPFSRLLGIAIWEKVVLTGDGDNAGRCNEQQGIARPDVSNEPLFKDVAAVQPASSSEAT